jgi:hypothetical protein
MSGCEWLSERMPAVALGRAEWTADEIQHLNGCRACQEEWEVVQRTNRLGQEIGRSLAAGPTSQVLRERLARARAARARRRTWSYAGLAAAAAVTAVVWTHRPPPRTLPHATAIVAGLPMALPELDGLQPAELESVLQMMDDPAPADSTLDELESFLDSWEG